MGAIQRWLRYAFENDDFASLPDDEPADERDKLLTLLAIYAAPAKFERHPSVLRLRSRLEGWLAHTLDQRVHGDRDPEDLLRAATELHAEFLTWLATGVDQRQVLGLLTMEASTDGVEDQPTSALYRLAMGAMLEQSPGLGAERRGARAVEALLPLPRDDAEWPRLVRGARWRDDVDARYMRDLRTLLATNELLDAS